jgi:hypothetical protein
MRPGQATTNNSTEICFGKEIEREWHPPKPEVPVLERHFQFEDAGKEGKQTPSDID